MMEESREYSTLIDVDKGKTSVIGVKEKLLSNDVFLGCLAGYE